MGLCGQHSDTAPKGLNEDHPVASAKKMNLSGCSTLGSKHSISGKWKSPLGTRQLS